MNGVPTADALTSFYSDWSYVRTYLTDRGKFPEGLIEILKDYLYHPAFFMQPGTLKSREVTFVTRGSSLNAGCVLSLLPGKVLEIINTRRLTQSTHKLALDRKQMEQLPPKLSQRPTIWSASAYSHTVAGVIRMNDNDVSRDRIVFFTTEGRKLQLLGHRSAFTAKIAIDVLNNPHFQFDTHSDWCFLQTVKARVYDPGVTSVIYAYHPKTGQEVRKPTFSPLVWGTVEGEEMITVETRGVVRFPLSAPTYCPPQFSPSKKPPKIKQAFRVGNQLVMLCHDRERSIVFYHLESKQFTFLYPPVEYHNASYIFRVDEASFAYVFKSVSSLHGTLVTLPSEPKRVRPSFKIQMGDRIKNSLLGMLFTEKAIHCVMQRGAGIEVTVFDYQLKKGACVVQ